MGKGSNRRPEDKAAIAANWPFEEKPINVWDPSDPDHPKHDEWLKQQEGQSDDERGAGNS